MKLNFFFRYFSSGVSYENLPSCDRTTTKKKSSFRDYVAQPQSPPNPQNYYSDSPTKRPAKPRLESRRSLSETRPRFDSLESNQQESYRTSYENLACPDLGLSLPNYYPDSRYDTDNTEENSPDENENIYKYNSQECLSYREKPYETYSYDENILLTTNSPLYDELIENNQYHRSKPVRTIRGHTPYYKRNNSGNNYFSGKPQSLPIFSDSYLSDLSLSDAEFQGGGQPGEPIYDKIENGVECYETESNFDEIKLNNANIEKSISLEYNSHSDYVQENPLYDEIPLIITDALPPDKQELKHTNGENLINSASESPTNIKLTSELKEIDSENGIKANADLSKPQTSNKETIKTYVQVQAPAEITVTADYKTVVKVETDNKIEETAANESDTVSDRESKQHSHNYLKEFLETQKGSKKPLQNFISKKISRAFGDKDLLSKKNSKLSSSDPNLSDNQYYSLPDVTVSKNLQKCEKIDRKLRKCEKQNNNKTPENRFIVNIGRHFDVTANSNVPVDVEVKISKATKSQKNKKLPKIKSDKKNDDKKFLEAVKNLKDTLNGSPTFDQNHNVGKPEIIGAIRKKEQSDSTKTRRISLRRSNSVIERPKTNISIRIKEKLPKEAEMSVDGNQCNREFQEKLGSMRNYWDKMVNGDKNDNERADGEEKSDEKESTVKVGEVIRKFEPKDEKEIEKPPSIVQLTKQVFEPKVVPAKVEKISPLVKEACGIFENPFFERADSSHSYESLNPNIVEIVDKEGKSEGNKVDRGVSPIENTEIQNKNQKPKGLAKEPEFDHIRYRVMKSDLFQKKIFANCEKESQFDGLMQYLQDYSFQELLIDNNIVIIEPIRSKVPHETSKIAKAVHNVTPLVHKSSEAISSSQNSTLRRHFFYHPIRVNKEMNDEELPNPDTVKQVRQYFEGRMKFPFGNKLCLNEFSKECAQYQQNGDPDKDRCSATDSNSNRSNASEFGSQENLFDSLTSERCCEQQYVSEDVLEKIRERGTCVTYYGGKVLDKRNGQPSLTKAIMDEIKGYEERNYECRCIKTCFGNSNSINQYENSGEKTDNKENYQGFKFRLLKSNSCSSRLELVGANNISEYKKKFFDKQKELVNEHNMKNRNKSEDAKGESEVLYVENATVVLNNSAKPIKENGVDKNKLNEQIKLGSQKQPKIIGEEMKREKRMIQWNEKCDDKNYTAVTFNNKAKSPDKAFHNYDKVGSRPKQIDDMEFEPYEVA